MLKAAFFLQIGVVYALGEEDDIFLNRSIVDVKYYITAEEVDRGFFRGQVELDTKECLFFEDSDRVPAFPLL